MAESKISIITDEEKALLLVRYLDTEWCDDVTQWRCVRCGRVAIHHYVSECQHLFCKNCKTVFSGEGQWKCPRCQEYVQLLDDQDVDTESAISQLQVCCPNKKYGCLHVDQLKNIVKHVKECENTLEAALPMEYKGTNTVDLLYKLVSELTQQLKELSDVVRTLKSGCDNNWKQTQIRLSDVENNVEMLMRQFAKEIDGFKSDLCSQTERLTNSEMQFKEGVSEMKPTLDLLREEVEKMKSEQIGLSAKADEVESFFQRMEKKVDDYKDQMDDLKSKMAAMETNIKSVSQLENKIFEFSRDLQQQNELMEKHRKDDKIEAEMKQKQMFDALRVEINNQNLAELITSFMTTMNDNNASLKKEMKEMEQRTVDKMEKIEKNVDKINSDFSDYKEQLYIDIAKHQKDNKESQEENRKMMEKMVIQTKKDFVKFQNNEIQPQFFQELMAMYEVYEWIIKDSELKLCTSEVFTIPGYNLEAQVQLRNDGNSVSYTSLQFIDNKTGRQRPDIKLMPKVAFILVDQSSKGTMAGIIRTGLYSFGQLFEYGKDMFKEGFEDKFVNSSTYLNNNCIKIKILVEFQSFASSFTSNNGCLVWKVDNYAKRVQMEKDDIVWYQESPYFYTSPQGYRVQLRLYIRHTYLTARLIFLTGEFDSFLTKTFPYKLTIIIVNQEDYAKNAVIAKICDKAENTEISDTSTDISSYVKNDSLLLQAGVEPM